MQNSERALEIIRESYTDKINANNLYEGNTPLTMALIQDSRDVVNALLQMDGIDINAQNKKGQSPLHLAAGKGNKEVVETLFFRNDIEVNLQDGLKKTPLHYAASRGHREIVEILLDAPRINWKILDSYRNTPLHSAVFNRHIKTSEAIARNYPEALSMKNSYGKTPLQLAKERVGSGPFLDFLDETSASYNLSAIREFRESSIENFAAQEYYGTQLTHEQNLTCKRTKLQYDAFTVVLENHYGVNTITEPDQESHYGDVTTNDKEPEIIWVKDGHESPGSTPNQENTDQRESIDMGEFMEAKLPPNQGSQSGDVTTNVQEQIIPRRETRHQQLRRRRKQKPLGI